MAACSGGSIDSSAENDTLPFCAFGQQALGEDAGRGKPAKWNLRVGATARGCLGQGSKEAVARKV
jgi:hypothetical protein